MSFDDAYDKAALAFAAGAELTTEQRRLLLPAIWNYPAFEDRITRAVAILPPEPIVVNGNQAARFIPPNPVELLYAVRDALLPKSKIERGPGRANEL